MADNTVINTASTPGQSIATKDIGGINHELVLLEFGDGAGGATEVEASTPLPVTDAVAEAALTSIAAEDFATSAKQDTGNTSLASIKTNTDTATALNSGVTTVTTAGTRVQVASNACKSVTVKAKIANTGKIYVGNVTVAAANGFELGAGDTISLDISNTNLIYIDSSVNAEGISFIFIT